MSAAVLAPGARGLPGAAPRWDLTAAFATLVLCALMSIPRSFAVAKLALLLPLLLLAMPRLILGWQRALRPELIFFYGAVAMLGLAWSALGLVHGAPVAAAVDSVRLYVAWSAAYLLVTAILLVAGDLRTLHRAIVAAAIVVPLLNFAGIADSYLGLGFFEEPLRKELDMFVGFHDGYVQVTSHNIGSLFFVTTYLIAMHVHQGMARQRTVWSLGALVLALLMCIASGRRALWLCLALQPLLLVLAFTACRAWDRSTLLSRRNGLIAAGALAAAAALLAYLEVDMSPATLAAHIRDAFGAEDERSIQSGYLLRGFERFVWFGSGFGIDAGYLRNDERPWIYELSYHQLAFNFGLVGLALIAMVGAAYAGLATALARTRGPSAGPAFCLLVGLASFLIGAYSNPYLGSFDFLLILTVLPLLASLNGLQRGPTGAPAP